ncbi:hypothetical protein BDA96_09G015700, partial [Sorghum bicolor]|uniref:Uncharacterized protein n=2 Tax=Sorghum bicolor TaxID=4558 RepID=C5YYL2_SORBI|eukprot:XP_021302600.1 uncharacterized protein LOC110430058 [Sorghum bicolor]
MARPTAAAALAACAAVLLLFAGQSVAILFPFGAFFPVDYVPPTVRIFISDKLSLNVAVYDHGDNTQIWWKIPPLPSLIDGEGDKYWLVNVATRQAMTSPTGNGQQVQLAEFNPFDSKGLQLWVPSPPRPQDAGFYQIQPNTDDDSALAGLFDGGDDVVHDGMEIGINSSTPVTSNNLWMTLNVIPYPS